MILAGAGVENISRHRMALDKYVESRVRHDIARQPVIAY
jgi:hypothetical protein